MKIVVDGFGGDYSPNEIVSGALMALSKDKALEVIITGDKDRLSALAVDADSRLSFYHTTEVIGCDEQPTAAIRTKKDSSLVKALDLLSTDQSVAGMVSAGSTGAVLVGATLKVGRMRGILRPALAPSLPTVKGGNVLLCDCGANVDCKSEYLVQFALMGISYMRGVYGIDNPRVALLSNGAEAEKGNEFTKGVHALLAAMDINFVGNVEARYILSGDYDVIVTDGFSGNIALKSAEGTAQAIFTMLKDGINKSCKAKLGALLLKDTLKGIKKRLDYNEQGGAAFLGLKKPLIKAHGASKAKSICGAILQAQSMAAGGITDKLAAMLTESGNE